MRRTRDSLVLLCAALLASIPMQIRAQAIGTVLTDDAARVIVKLKADSSLLREQARAGTRPAAWFGDERRLHGVRSFTGGIRQRHHLGRAGAATSARKRCRICR